MSALSDAEAAVAEAHRILADPEKAEYHERLQEAVSKLEAEMEWWAQLRNATQLWDMILQAD